MPEVIEQTKNKKGYKKTKLGWIPEDWDMVKIKNLTCVKSGSTPLRANYNKYFKDGTIKWVKTLDLNNGVLQDTQEKITDIAIRESSCSIFPKNTILVAMYGGFNQIGRTGLMNFDGCINQALSAILPNDKFNPVYMLNWLNYNVLEWRNYAASSRKDPNITKNDVEKFIVILPSKQEQEKIAEILSTWDDGIETLEKLIEQKEILKTSFAQKYFQRKNNLFPLKQHKLSELFTNRKETSCCDLELLSVCDGLGIIPRSQLNAKDNSNEDKSKYLKVCIGDLAYNTMRMWQGRCGVSSYEGIVSPAYTVCIPKDNIDVDYMYYLFKTPHMIHDFWRYSQGIVDDTLNLKFNNFKVIKVWIPDKGTQTKIAKLLKSYDEELQLLNSKLEKLKEQKKGLMQKLLTGQIRVKI